MIEKETIFLTFQQALEAVCIDFRRYAPQVMLFSAVLRVISNGKLGYRIWVDPETGEMIDKCPFLKHLPDENRWLCRIHDVKPVFCREYPVSRKHGRMTGCLGFLR